MKNTKLKFLLSIIGVVGFMSCKNDYTCNCTMYNNGEIKHYDTAFSNFIRKDAIYFCDKLESDWMRSNLSGDNKDTIYKCDLNKIR